MDAADPLRWIRVVQQWELCAIGADGRRVRVFYVGDGSPLADVAVAETTATVAITLFQRALVGRYPDGAVAAGAAVGFTRCLQVELREPLGDRKVLDGSTGKPCRRADHGSIPPDSDDAALLRIPEDACPLWVP